jgi:DNA polymerase-3 subunit delta
VAAFDRELLGRIGAWEEALAEPPAEGRKKKKPAKAGTDLQLARNPANPFPVYQTLKKADRFSRAELLAALEAAAEADIRLKSSALAPRLVLERLVWRICSPSA